jgi:hypothetical protein
MPANTPKKSIRPQKGKRDSKNMMRKGLIRDRTGDLLQAVRCTQSKNSTTDCTVVNYFQLLGPKLLTLSGLIGRS